VNIVDFTRGGQRLYSSVVYTGYVGLLTGVRPGRLSVTVDSRFDNNLDQFLMAWLRNPADPAVLLSQMLRTGLEDDAVSADYDGYLAYVGGSTLVGPAYSIIGGGLKGQGAVLTLGPNMTAPVDIWRLDDALPADAPAGEKFYVLETNYDHWERVPKIDDRQSASEDCMDHYVTANGVSKEAIYNVLHAMPNRNRLTTYTALMDVAEGTIEASLQYCYDPECTLW